MAEKMSLPPQNLNGISRPGRGMVVVKPKNIKGTLVRLWQLTKGHRQGLGWILLLSALSSGAAILSPYVTGEAISAVNNYEPLNFVLIMLSAIFLADWLIKLLEQLLMASMGQRIIHHIRVSLFDKIKNLPLAFFDRHQHGELMSRLTNDVDNISTTISNSLTMLLTNAFTIVGVLVMMLVLSPLLTFIALISVVLIFVLTKVVTNHTRKLFLERSRNLGALNGHVEEGISGLFVVKAFGQEEKMAKEFEEKNEKLCDTAIKALVWSGYLMPLMNVINNLCFVAVSVISGLLFVKGYITEIGLITSFLLYIRRFTRPFVDTANIYNNFQTAVAGAERIFEIMDEEREPEDGPLAVSLNAPKGDIVFNHVDFGYNPSKLILKDINLDIKKGTKVAIVGPTGSGKTTIINLLTRFYDVTGGSIFLDGHDLRDIKMEDLRKAFGVVLQDTSLFEASIRENISYGNGEATLEEIKAAAESCGADAFIERLPEGYDTVLTMGGSELSQGERQLLTIARALLTNAPIMILDEATSSVDTVTEQKIRKAMLKICEGRTSFIIAHRLSTIRDSDLIILIDEGRIAEKGTHEELLSLGGQYAKMFRTQTGTGE